jgi:cytidylate kinase
MNRTVPAQLDGPPREETALPVICISHALGSRGEEIGRLLADELGLRYVDDEIIEMAAEADHALPEAVAMAESRHAGREIEVDFNRFEHTDSVRELIRGAVVSTADEGGVVIVAHAACFALADREDVLRIHVTGSPDRRSERLHSRYGLSPKDAVDRVKDSDADRDAYLKDAFGIRHDSPTHYDFVVNTDRLDTPTAACAIAAAVREGLKR